MALILHNTQDRPFGQFDSLDSTTGHYKGGEIVTWTHVATPAAGGTDLATADVLQDGYVPGAAATRTAVTFASSATDAPLFLSDDGCAHYGVLFGVVLGANVGRVSYGPGGGTNLGPPTDVASGKVTCWAQSGLYGVTLDAVDITPNTGLIPSN